MSHNVMPLQGASNNDDLLVKTDMKAKFTMDSIHIAQTVICISEP